MSSDFGGVGILDVSIKGIKLLLSEIISDFAELDNDCANIITITCAEGITHVFTVDDDFQFEFTDHNEWLFIRAWNNRNDAEEGYYERALISVTSIIQITSEN